MRDRKKPRRVNQEAEEAAVGRRTKQRKEEQREAVAEQMSEQNEKTEDRKNDAGAAEVEVHAEISVRGVAAMTDNNSSAKTIAENHVDLVPRQLWLRLLPFLVSQRKRSRSSPRANVRRVCAR